MCYFRCKGCGCKANHTSVFHSARKRNPGTFSLPSNHDCCKLSWKTVGVATGTGDSEGSGVVTQ